MILRCDARTQVDSNLTREASTQTSHRNEKPRNRNDGGAADKEQEELKRKIATLENILEEKDLQIQKQNETIKKMKEQHRSEIQNIRTKEEIEKRSLLQKIRNMRNEIMSLEERRPPKAKRVEPSAEQESLGPDWNHVKAKEEMQNSLPPKVRDLREVIISRKERRSQTEKRAEPSAEHVVRGGRFVEEHARGGYRVLFS
jgi:hypothetical protein